MQIIEAPASSDAESAYVRQYDGARDKDDFVTIFKETADTALQKPDLLTISSYIWCHPYISLEPTWCFALAIRGSDASTTISSSSSSATLPPSTSNATSPSTTPQDKDKAIGYILCAPSTLPFLKQWQTTFLKNTVGPSGECPAPTTHPNEDYVPGEWDSDRAMALRRMVWFPRRHMVNEKFPRLLEDYPAHLHIDIRARYQRHGGGRALMDALFEKLRAEKIKGIHLDMAAHNTAAGKFYEAVGFRKFERELGGADGGRLTEGGIIYVRKVE